MPLESLKTSPLNQFSQRELATERIKNLIHRGKFSSMGYLPSIRKMADMIGLNRDAVWRAYADLEKEFYIESTRNRRFRIHPALANTHLRTLDARLITVGENSIRFSGLQRFHKTLVENESAFGIRTHLKCVIDANDIQPEWMDGMDCLILGGYFEQSQYLDSLAADIPSIGIITSSDWRPDFTIDTDNQQMGKLAASRFIDTGCQSPCLIAYSNEDKRHTLRKLGFQVKWIENGGSIDDIPEYWIDPSNSYKKVIELERIARTLGDRDSVFCLDKESAVDLLNILEYLEVIVPDQIKVISADGTFDGLQTKPKLTIVKQRFEDMALIAAEKIRLIGGQTQDPQNKVLVPADLIIRESA